MCEAFCIAGNPVVKARASGDDQVCLIQCQAGVCDAVHAGHANVQRVICGDSADAEQGCDDGDLRLLGEFPKFIVSVRNQHAVAGQDDRSLGLIDQLGRGCDIV